MKIDEAVRLIQIMMMQQLTQQSSIDGTSQNTELFKSILEGLLKAQTNENSVNQQQTGAASSNLDKPEEQSDGLKSTTIEAAIKEASRKYGVDEALIRAVIKQESGFNPKAVSSAGAMGLMQLMPSTAKSLGIDNPFDPIENIEGGTKYLRRLIDSFKGQKELALAAYNGGIGRMNRRGVDTVEEIVKMPNETVNYVDKVMKNYQKYKSVDRKA
ncbi:Membrane-bound lytic murein transglycosylase C precursor [Caloramator mitchellensis]|uniref:Membrane-bound lytic murein transglycosylase C n=1 Tax=Caloramator mitchellensis TaxID=908809 RepID=A0A0R3JVE0_CALMK|nr:lytic transglycosylase domain-containing protein [Caloramator mitchellensis]KRQ87543.1 Membrane-bound lytic murein transglycosylase C precursor [Caloramator mitchellensis]